MTDTRQKLVNQLRNSYDTSGLPYQGKLSDLDRIFDQMATELSNSGITDISQVGQSEEVLSTTVIPLRKIDDPVTGASVFTYTTGLGMGGDPLRTITVNPEDVSYETKQGAFGLTQSVPVLKKPNIAQILINKETGEKISTTKYGGVLTPSVDGGYRWGNVTRDVEGMADFRVSFDEQGKPTFFPVYGSTKSDKLIDFVKGAATLYAGAKGLQYLQGGGMPGFGEPSGKLTSFVDPATGASVSTPTVTTYGEGFMGLGGGVPTGVAQVSPMGETAQMAAANIAQTGGSQFAVAPLTMAEAATPSILAGLTPKDALTVASVTGAMSPQPVMVGGTLGQQPMQQRGVDYSGILGLLSRRPQPVLATTPILGLQRTTGLV